MKDIIIRAVNEAHLHPSPWVRRPVIVAGIAALALISIGFWLLLPLWVALAIIIPVFQAVFEAIVEMPGMTITSLKDEWKTWAINLAGAARIWHAQKIKE